jgi:hypothetical protein
LNQTAEVEMEYRGKEYSVVQGPNGSWKWYVVLDGHTKSGKAPDRQAGIKFAEAEIDRLLLPPKPKKKRLIPPGSAGR